MYIQTAKIRNNIEPVLYDDNDKPLLLIPTSEDEDGNRFMHVHVAITNYLKRKALGKKIHPLELDRVYELIDNFRRTNKWEPTKEDWNKSLDELIQDDEMMYGRTNLSKLQKHVRKAIPDPPKPNLPKRPMKVKRPLEPVEILPPVMPKEVLKKIREKSI